jgi:peptide/nickel transport system ATP-binding protein
MTAPLLVADDLVRRYALPRRVPWRPAPRVEALAGVSLTLAAGRSLGIVGESGSGKSTLARLVMGFERPDAGRVLFTGEDLDRLPATRLQALRRDFQMVFQDPYGSLDPRFTVARLVGEPLDMLAPEGRAARAERIAASLRAVGLAPGDAGKFPHEFSGGQRQRIAIARALITRPKLIVADEPVSALDVSVQAQVLNLMKALEAEQGVTYLLISHDLAVIEYVTAEVAVMFRGRIVEQGPTDAVLAAPRHPYTRALQEAAPRLVAGRRRGRVASTAARDAPPDGDAAPAGGCSYAPRCPLAEPRCRAERPALRDAGAGRRVACHLA